MRAIMTSWSRPVARIATARHRLRALAAGPPAAWQEGAWCAQVRPLVAEAQAALEHRLAGGGSLVEYHHARARLADGLVIGLLHLASVAVGLRDEIIVPPLTACALGRYAANELGAHEAMRLLFLLVPGADPRRSQATSAFAVEGLRKLGFAVEHAAYTPAAAVAMAHRDRDLQALLRVRRYLWGCFGLEATLDRMLAAQSRARRRHLAQDFIAQRARQ
jgi:hypothetical protein